MMNTLTEVAIPAFQDGGRIAKRPIFPDNCGISAITLANSDTVIYKLREFLKMRLRIARNRPGLRGGMPHPISFKPNSSKRLRGTATKAEFVATLNLPAEKKTLSNTSSMHAGTGFSSDVAGDGPSNSKGKEKDKKSTHVICRHCSASVLGKDIVQHLKSAHPMDLDSEGRRARSGGDRRNKSGGGGGLKALTHALVDAMAKADGASDAMKEMKKENEELRADPKPEPEPTAGQKLEARAKESSTIYRACSSLRSTEGRPEGLSKPPTKSNLPKYSTGGRLWPQNRPQGSVVLGDVTAPVPMMFPMLYTLFCLIITTVLCALVATSLTWPQSRPYCTTEVADVRMSDCKMPHNAWSEETYRVFGVSELDCSSMSLPPSLAKSYFLTDEWYQMYRANSIHFSKQGIACGAGAKSLTSGSRTFAENECIVVGALQDNSQDCRHRYGLSTEEFASLNDHCYVHISNDVREVCFQKELPLENFLYRFLQNLDNYKGTLLKWVLAPYTAPYYIFNSISMWNGYVMMLWMMGSGVWLTLVVFFSSFITIVYCTPYWFALKCLVRVMATCMDLGKRFRIIDELSFQYSVAFTELIIPTRSRLIAIPYKHLGESANDPDFSPDFDKEVFRNEHKFIKMKILIEVKWLGYYYYFDSPSDLPKQWVRGKRLRTVFVNDNLFSTGINRKTMLAGRATPEVALATSLRLLSANDHYHECAEVIRKGESTYRDMALLLGAIITRSPYNENQNF